MLHIQHYGENCKDRDLSLVRESDVYTCYFKQWLSLALVLMRDASIYIGAKKNETHKYASESTDMLRRFFALYQFPLNVVVFSDNGKSFFPNGVSVLESLGFAKHVSYPAPVHSTSHPTTIAYTARLKRFGATVEWTSKMTWSHRNAPKLL